MNPQRLSCVAVIAAMIVLSVAAARADRVLTVGVHDDPPMVIKKPNGEWSGISIDLMRLVATDIGAGSAAEPTPVPVPVPVPWPPRPRWPVVRGPTATAMPVADGARSGSEITGPPPVTSGSSWATVGTIAGSSAGAGVEAEL